MSGPNEKPDAQPDAPELEGGERDVSTDVQPPTATPGGEAFKSGGMASEGGDVGGRSGDGGMSGEG